MKAAAVVVVVVVVAAVVAAVEEVAGAGRRVAADHGSISKVLFRDLNSRLRCP